MGAVPSFHPYSTLKVPLLKMGSADDASDIRNMTTAETDLPLSLSQSRQRQRGGKTQIFTTLTADRRLLTLLLKGAWALGHY